jgi:hypothetical protein
VAYGDDEKLTGDIRYIAGQVIPDDPGINEEGKRKLPPPLAMDIGGSSPQ